MDTVGCLFLEEREKGNRDRKESGIDFVYMRRNNEAAQIHDRRADASKSAEQISAI